MNIFKEYMADVNGVEIFAIISLGIFLVVFTLMVIHTFLLKKKEIMRYKNIPLEDEINEDKENETLNK